MSDVANKILEKALPHIPFDGWNMAVLRRAAKEAGLEEGYAEIAFPAGEQDALKLFIAQIDEKMHVLFRNSEADCKGIRDKITKAIMLRLSVMQPHREVVRKSLNHLSNPINLPLSLALTYHTVDEIWYMIGDKSTDFNFYSKRFTLAGVYSSTLLFWLNDNSENYQQTQAFLERRIANVMQITTFRKTVESKLSSCLSLFRT